METSHWNVDWEKWNADLRSGELISFCVKGTAYENDNGESRASIIDKMNTSERVELKHDINNKYDSDAIGVYCANGMIGYVPKGMLDEVSSVIKDDVMVKAKVKTGQFSQKYVVIEILIPQKTGHRNTKNYTLESKVVGISKDEKENIVPFLDIGEEVLVFFIYSKSDCRYSDDVYVTPKSYFTYDDETILGRLEKKSALEFKKHIETTIQDEINWFDMQRKGYVVRGSVKSASPSGQLIVKIEVGKA